MAPKATLNILIPCLVVAAALFLFLIVESKADDDTLSQVNQFLQNYGYYSMGGSEEAAIKLFQKNYGLEQTGEADAATIAKMGAPRCGNPDMMTIGDIPIWSNKQNFTYRFVLGTESTVPLEQLRRIFATAFSRWAQHSVFGFQEMAPPERVEEADILIGFFNRPLDVDGVDRALTFIIMELQPISLHLNAAEKWCVTGEPGGDEMDLESVAVHLIGDMLGLVHRTDPESVMYAVFSPGVTKRDLGQQDIDAIRALYPN